MLCQGCVEAFERLKFLCVRLFGNLELQLEVTNGCLEGKCLLLFVCDLGGMLGLRSNQLCTLNLELRRE